MGKHLNIFINKHHLTNDDDDAARFYRRPPLAPQEAKLRVKNQWAKLRHRVGAMKINILVGLIRICAYGFKYD